MFPPDPLENAGKGAPGAEAGNLRAQPKLASTASEAEIQEYNKLCLIMEELVGKNEEVDIQEKLAKHIEKESKKKEEESNYTHIVKNLDYAAAKRKGFKIPEPHGETCDMDQTIGLEFESFTAMLQDGDAPIFDLSPKPSTSTAAMRPQSQEVSHDGTWPTQGQLTQRKRESQAMK